MLRPHARPNTGQNPPGIRGETGRCDPTHRPRAGPAGDPAVGRHPHGRRAGRPARRRRAHRAALRRPTSSTWTSRSRSVRGRYGGYRLAPGYRMPPLMLTDEEALAVLLGLLAVPPGRDGHARPPWPPRAPRPRCAGCCPSRWRPAGDARGDRRLHPPPRPRPARRPPPRRPTCCCSSREAARDRSAGRHRLHRPRRPSQRPHPAPLRHRRPRRALVRDRRGLGERRGAALPARPRHHTDGARGLLRRATGLRPGRAGAGRPGRGALPARGRRAGPRHRRRGPPAAPAVRRRRRRHAGRLLGPGPHPGRAPRLDPGLARRHGAEVRRRAPRGAPGARARAGQPAARGGRSAETA